MKDGPADLRPDDSNGMTPKELKNFVQLNLVGNNTEGSTIVFI